MRCPGRCGAMHSRTLRDAARAALPKEAFLRRDRGEALFVTDAPRFDPDANRPQRLELAGFHCARRGALLLLTPKARWLEALEAESPVPPDEFCRGFLRFAGRPVEAESLALFALGARVLDGEADDGRFERRLRQRAAVCLRGDPTCGGGLYACALVNHLIKEART